MFGSETASELKLKSYLEAKFQTLRSFSAFASDLFLSIKRS